MRRTKAHLHKHPGAESFRFRPQFCGPYRARTDDLLGVNQML